MVVSASYQTSHVTEGCYGKREGHRPESDICLSYTPTLFIVTFLPKSVIDEYSQLKGQEEGT